MARWTKLFLVGLATLVVLGQAAPAAAQSAPAAQTTPTAKPGQAGSTAIAQGFQVDAAAVAKIVPGALVSAKVSNPHAVELATIDSASRLVGVVDKNPLLSLGTGTNEAQVVSSGGTTVLVSDINGAIKAGDKITASPIEGVGMRANKESQVVGATQGDFSTIGVATKTIRDRDGRDYTVHIGLVGLQVSVAYYQPPGGDFLPPFIQNLADVLAGKPVSLVRIVLSGTLLLIGLVGFITLVTTAARSSISSMGRNPLAAASIHRGLLQMIIVAVLVLLATILAGYVILRV